MEVGNLGEVGGEGFLGGTFERCAGAPSKSGARARKERAYPSVNHGSFTRG